MNQHYLMAVSNNSVALKWKKKANSADKLLSRGLVLLAILICNRFLQNGMSYCHCYVSVCIDYFSDIKFF